MAIVSSENPTEPRKMTRPLTRTTKQIMLVTSAASLLIVLLMTSLLKRNPWTTDQSETFLVNSKSCQIPNFEPRHESIVKFLKPSEPIRCSRRDPMTYTVTAEDGRNVLYVNRGVVEQYTSSSQPVVCCYTVIVGREYKPEVCVQLDQEAPLDDQTELILVKCCLDKITNPVLYNNMHAVVKRIPDDKKNLEEEVRVTEKITSEYSLEGTTTGNEHNQTEIPVPDIETIEKLARLSGSKSSKYIPELRPNILILGIDSMSRLNLLRTMPKTVSHLKINNWQEFRGYNKIGYGTRPNLMAILTGLDRTQLEQLDCWPSDDEYLDHCPFIWKDFSARGYTTAYAEDTAVRSVFTFEGERGFRSNPTDYFFHPFIEAMEHGLPTQWWMNNIVCVGPTSVTDYILKYTLDLFTSVTRQPLFSLSWLNNFSHDTNNIPLGTDDTILKFLEDLEQTGTFNNTLVIFLSDHGNRFGAMLKTYVGWLEERLPFLYMRVPDWFQTKYPQAYLNLQDNGNKLTSPFDLHLTLRDIVDDTVEDSSGGSRGCPKCGSLFSPVAKERRCADAGISQHWCSCTRHIQMSPEDDVIQNAAGFLVSYINAKVAKTDYDCEVLDLHSVKEARLKDNASSDSRVYVIVFVTSPGSMVFDATVRYRPKDLGTSSELTRNVTTGSEFEVLGTINRINSYKETSDCVQDRDMKLYCKCP